VHGRSWIGATEGAWNVGGRAVTRDRDTVDALAYHRAAMDGLGGGFTVLRAVRDDDAIVDWEILDANAVVHDVWDPLFTELVGVRISQLNRQADNGQADALYEAAVATGQRQEAELPLNLPGREQVWRRTVVVPVAPDTIGVMTSDVTAERTARDALKAERARFATLVEYSSDVVAIVDATGRVIDRRGKGLPDDGNDPAAAVSSLTLIPQDLERTTEWFRRTLDAGPGARSEPVALRFHDAEGNLRICELSASNRLDDPVIGGIVVAVHDVTDLVNAEARATALAEHVSDVLVITDAEARITWTSPAVQRVLGFSPERLVGMDALTMIHPDDRSLVAERMAAVVSDASYSIPTELRVVAADGTTRWFEAAGANRLEDPALRGLVVSMHDITERREAEVALRDSEARNRNILETAADAIITVDETGRIEGFNRAAEQIFRAPAAEVIGGPYSDLLPASSLAVLRHKTAEGADMAVDPIELMVTRRSGEAFPSQISLSSVEVEGRRLYTAIVRDITEQKRIEGRLETMALHDELTGLPNRRLLVDRIHEAIARARRWGSPVAVMFLDLDRFKLVNDSLGHDVGDLLLVLVAARIRAAIRETDTLARLGGDEFVILCESLHGMDSVSELAVRVAASLEAPFTVGGEEVFVTASLGIVVWDGGDETPVDLLRAADTAMYRAKDHGRARFELFDEAMQAWVSARLELESGLRHAIEREELRVHYQPIVSFDGGRVTHLEALARWDRPNAGIVMPDEFIGIAEETGLIVAVGEWILHRVVADCSAWQDVAPGVGASVNVSARQLTTGDFRAAVRTALDETGLDPRLLTLEITESVLLDDTARNLAEIRELRSLGVRLALDDFGTGFSSLTYLRRLPIDALKIDESFVSSIDTETGDTVLLRTIVELGRAYELDVVAEGIDSPSKLEALRAMGCRYGQGYLFGRPAPVHDAVAALALQHVIGATGAERRRHLPALHRAMTSGR